MSVPPRFLVLVCLTMLLLITAGPVAAVQVDGLYQVEVPVETRDRPERQEVLGEALTRVLVRMTGNRTIGEFPEAKPLLESASRYVQQFRYADAPSAEAAQGKAYLLQVTFDGVALERALEARGLPVWGRERPAVLVWLAVREPGDNYLVAGSSGQAAKASMQAAAEDRGVPLVFPLYDLEDQAQVTFSDVSGGFHENILNASERYRPDAVLVGRATRSSGLWDVRWSLYYGDQPFDWESSSAGLGVALQEGVHGLAGTLAARLSSSAYSDAASGTLVVVSGVRRLEDYVRISRYLGGLGPVLSRRTYRISPEKAEFLIEARGGSRDLERVIGLGDLLQAQRVEAPLAIPEQGPLVTPAEPSIPTLHFRLL